MQTPVEAGAHLKEVEAVVRKPSKGSSDLMDNILGRSLKATWGKPYVHNTFVYQCLIAIRMFCLEASPKRLMLDFQESYTALVEYSASFSQVEWCRLMMRIFKDEVQAAQSINSVGLDVDSIVRPKKPRNYTFDRNRHFPGNLKGREKIQARLVALKAASRCGVSPLFYLWENDLVDISLVPA